VNKHSDIVKDALKRLRIAESSESTLRLFLEKKGYGKKEIAEVIDYLKTKKFVDDYRYCTILIEKYIRKKKGIGYIHNILSLHGIPENIISTTLAKTYPEGLEYTLAENVLKSIKKKSPVQSISRLKSRGFSEKTIEKLIEKYRE